MWFKVGQLERPARFDEQTIINTDDEEVGIDIRKTLRATDPGGVSHGLEGYRVGIYLIVFLNKYKQVDFN